MQYYSLCAGQKKKGKLRKNKENNSVAHLSSPCQRQRTEASPLSRSLALIVMRKGVFVFWTNGRRIREQDIRKSDLKQTNKTKTQKKNKKNDRNIL